MIVCRKNLDRFLSSFDCELSRTTKMFFAWVENSKGVPTSKVIIQGRLIEVAHSCVHIETSSLWVEFVNRNRCISVRLVSEEDKII